MLNAGDCLNLGELLEVVIFVGFFQRRLTEESDIAATHHARFQAQSGTNDRQRDILARARTLSTKLEHSVARASDHGHHIARRPHARADARDHLRGAPDIGTDRHVNPEQLPHQAAVQKSRMTSARRSRPIRPPRDSSWSIKTLAYLVAIRSDNAPVGVPIFFMRSKWARSGLRSRLVA